MRGECSTKEHRDALRDYHQALSNGGSAAPSLLRALTSYRRARRYDMAEDILKVLAEDYPDDLAAAGRRRKSAARPKR